MSTQPWVSRVHVGVPAVAEVPTTADALSALVDGGHRFLLVDLIRNFYLGPFAPRGALVEALAERCAPAATFPNAWAGTPAYLFEFNYSLPATLERIERASADRYDVIEVYDLEACRPGAGAPSPGETT